MHLLRRRPRGRRQQGRVREVWREPPRRGQAAALRRNVLDQIAACRRWRDHCPDLQGAGDQARLRLGSLGLEDSLPRDNRILRRDVGERTKYREESDGVFREISPSGSRRLRVLADHRDVDALGRPLLLPLIGFEAFSEWSQWAKYAHNYLSFPFTIGVVLIFLMWIVGNIPNKVDVDWLKRGGGLVGHDHPPAYRFNAGQKAIYWIVVIGGAAVAGTGYELMFPFYLSGIEGMQLAEIVHSVVAVLFVAAMLAHIYIGTVGMEGAFEAMGSGTVDINWAKEHHRLWLEEENARTGANDARPQPAATAAE